MKQHFSLPPQGKGILRTADLRERSFAAKFCKTTETSGFFPFSQP
jgi:hypothetical protein